MKPSGFDIFVAEIENVADLDPARLAKVVAKRSFARFVPLLVGRSIIGGHGIDERLERLWIIAVDGIVLGSAEGLQLLWKNSDQLDFYLYSRAQSVMGGTSQVQKNIIATRILDLPVG